MSAGSILSTRPDWTKSTTGIRFDVVARIYGTTTAKPNISTSRNRVSLVKGDSVAAKPEDEYDVQFVYGNDATNVDIAKRHIEPLVKKSLEGYNTCVIAFGATGAGKTTTIEGSRAHDSKTSPEGDGVVHQAIDILFKLLNDKAVSVGDKVAAQRRMPGSKAYDFFVESSFVEVYNETCHDLYQRGDAVRENLPIYEDDMEGYIISGLTHRMSKTGQEMRSSFNYGRMMRDMQHSDEGSVHERATAIYTIHLAQYSPSTTLGQEDSVMISKLVFVDMPGSERLAMDPDLLRLREGQVLNKGLLSFASTLETLARNGNSDSVNYEACALTKLLADPLGGNSLVLMIGNLRQGSTPQGWTESSTTLQQLMKAKQAKTYPIINHGRARGLFQMLRRRMQTILNDRETLREQLNEVPADGDPNAMAISIARVRDLEARVNAEREEKAMINQEKQALQARLSKLRDAETGDLQERAELQDSLIKCEENRLALARMLIDTQMDINEKESQWEAMKLDLEKKVVELEARHVERFVKADDHAGLMEQRDELNTQLLATQDEVQRRKDEIAELKAEIDNQQEKIRKMNQELNLIGGGQNMDDDLRMPEASEVEGAEGDTIEAKRRKLFTQIKIKNREISELQAAMKELQKECDRIRNRKAITKAGADEIREAYRRKLETNMRDIADMSRAVAIMQNDPSTGLKVTPEDLFNTFQRLTDENMKITEDREKEMRQDLDDLHGRHVELKRKFRTLYLAYRQLRYLIENDWPPNGIPPPPQVPTEDEVLGSTFEDISRSEEEADRRLILRLRERTSHLDSQLRALKLAGAAGEKGIKIKPSNLSQLTREQQGNEKYIDQPEMLRFENEKLREELERLKKVIGTGGQGANQKLLQENALLVSQIKTLSTDKNRAQLATEISQLKAENESLKTAGGGRSAKEVVNDYANKSQAELERKLANAEARKVMAEEQLESMQKYLTQATVQYQREIVRLRAIIGQMDPGLLKSNPLQGQGAK